MRVWAGHVVALRVHIGKEPPGASTLASICREMKGVLQTFGAPPPPFSCHRQNRPAGALLYVVSTQRWPALHCASATHSPHKSVPATADGEHMRLPASHTASAPPAVLQASRSLA